MWLLLRKEFLPKNEALFLNRQGERITIYNTEEILSGKKRDTARSSHFDDLAAPLQGVCPLLFRVDGIVQLADGGFPVGNQKLPFAVEHAVVGNSSQLQLIVDNGGQLGNQG